MNKQKLIELDNMLFDIENILLKESNLTSVPDINLYNAIVNYRNTISAAITQD